jgi:hypothetical protein
MPANPAMPHCDTLESITGAPLHKREPRYSALMKNLYIVPYVLMWLGSMAVAQSRDWEVVHGIPAGTTIKVTLKHKPTFGHCVLEEVTDDGLACYSRTSGERQFARKDIRAVYVAHNAKLVGLAVGASIGVLDGAVNNPSTGLSRGGNAIFGALLVGGIGMAIGAAAGPFFGGKAIYRGTDGQPKKAKHPPSLEPAKSAISDASRPTLDACSEQWSTRQSPVENAFAGCRRLPGASERVSASREP